MADHSADEFDQLVYVVSHDMQAPVRHIRAFLGLLEGQLPDLDPSARDLMARIQGSCGLLEAQLANLLRLSRVGGKELEPGETETGAAVQAAWDALQAGVQRGVGSVEIDELPTLWMDPGLLQVVLTELLGNALRFRSPDRELRIRVRGARVGDGWRIDVEDNGRGFEPRHNARVFELWQVLHPADEGAGRGVGLALCQRIVCRHGGRIGVESTLDVGSRFWFELPGRPITPGG